MAERYALIRREPFIEIAPFDTGIDRFFDDALSLFDLPLYGYRPLFTELGVLAPLEVFDSDGHTVVRLEAPGMKMEDFDISVSDGILTIKGEKKHEEEVKEEDYYCSEKAYGSFRRSVSVPKGLDESKIHATYEDGVLELILPRSEEKKEHKVKVQTKKAKG